jgi:quercetin dioxygenase-like cupin family protein
MIMDYVFIDNLAQVVEIPPDGILSRTIYEHEQFKAILFGFDAGQELSEHTASVPAVLYIVQGEAALTLGEDTKQAQPGTWVEMPARLPHAVYAQTPVVMLLIMAKNTPRPASD